MLCPRVAQPERTRSEPASTSASLRRKDKTVPIKECQFWNEMDGICRTVLVSRPCAGQPTEPKQDE